MMTKRFHSRETQDIFPYKFSRIPPKIITLNNAIPISNPSSVTYFLHQDAVPVEKAILPFSGSSLGRAKLSGLFHRKFRIVAIYCIIHLLIGKQRNLEQTIAG